MSFSPLFSRLQSFMNQHQLLAPSQTLIVGLSGGPDSVFLLHFLQALKKEYSLTLVAAHLDHQWRPESHKDVLFCKNIALNYDIPFISKNLSELPLTLKQNGSQEEVGRKARRFFLEQVAHDYNAHAIALAHHADDQQETFFIRLIRGTSLAGLTSMKPREAYYIRPLLTIGKQEILEYLHEHAIAYLIDPTNESDAYLRNRIRKALPTLKNVDSRFDQNFAATLNRLQDTEHFIKQCTNEQYEKVCPHHELDITLFLTLPAFIQQRILITWLCNHNVPFTPSQGLLDEIVRFFKQSKNIEHEFYNQWKIKKQKKYAIILNIGGNKALESHLQK